MGGHQSTLAESLVKGGDLKDAVTYSQRALQVYSRQSGFSSGKAATYRSLFLSNLLLGNVDLAEGYFYESNLNALYANPPLILKNMFDLLLFQLVEQKKTRQYGTKNDKQSLPSSHAIYRAAVEVIPRIAENHPGRIDYLASQTLSHQFSDCLERRDKKGCNEVMHDLQDLADRLILVPLDAKEGLGAFSEAYSSVFPQEDEEALSRLEHEVESNPNDSEAHFRKGEALYKFKRLEEALVEYGNAVKIDPRNPKYHDILASTLSDTGQYDQAISEYNKAIDLDPKEAKYHGNKGITLAEQEKYEEAIGEFDAAIGLEDKISDFYHNKGTALMRLGRLDEAISQFDKALELNPSDSNSYSNKGSALIKQERYDLAVPVLEKAIESNPENPNAHLHMADALANLGHYSEAIQEYDEAIELGISDPAAYNNREFCRSKLKQYKGRR